ncbi:MAG: hypothetical protein ACOC6J_10295, partial [Spirochaetota bacterium]
LLRMIEAHERYLARAVELGVTEPPVKPLPIAGVGREAVLSAAEGAASAHHGCHDRPDSP